MDRSADPVDRKMDELFPTKDDLKIVRLTEADARGTSDHLVCLRDLVAQNEPMYPDIHKWFNQRVVPGISSHERVAYVAYMNEKPAASAIVKRDKLAKFCHLRIRDDLQDKHLGEAFFALMSLEVRGFAEEIHFTLPESLWERKAGFFHVFGFQKAIKAGHQYRLFDDELRCSSTFADVWRATQALLPKITSVFRIDDRTLTTGIVLSMRPENAHRVISGEEAVEIRRSFSRKWVGERAALYASKPRKSLVGEATIRQVITDRPENVWQRFGAQIGCSRQEFDDFTHLCHTIHAITFRDVVPYAKEVPLSEMATISGRRLRPPQNYYSLERNATWGEALSIGSLLKDRLDAFRQDSRRDTAL